MSDECCKFGEDGSGCESWLLSTSERACVGGSPIEWLVRRIGVIGVTCGVISERGKP